jgi:molybdenum cofactor biosynthesis enzyme
MKRKLLKRRGRPPGSKRATVASIGIKLDKSQLQYLQDVASAAGLGLTIADVAAVLIATRIVLARAK